MCRLCIVLGGDFVVVVVSLFIADLHCVCRLCIVLGLDCVAVVCTVYCCSHCVCRLCIVLGLDCVVVVSLFIAAPIVSVSLWVFPL